MNQKISLMKFIRFFPSTLFELVLMNWSVSGTDKLIKRKYTKRRRVNPASNQVQLKMEHCEENVDIQ